MPFADLVGVKSSSAAAAEGPDRSALATTSNASDCGARAGRTGNGQLVAVFLPESAVIVTTVPSGLGRRQIRHTKKEDGKYQKKNKQSFHLASKFTCI